MIKNLSNLLIQSWGKTKDCLHETSYLLDWIKKENKERVVSLKPTTLSNCYPWFYDEQLGSIHNTNSSFFSINGLRVFSEGSCIGEQPIILQNEIGYLGIIFKEIQGTLYALMQAKIEPGNVNKVQISPTIQATKSNFTKKHGGGEPPYLSYFLIANKEQIIFDQVQSEQSSRFYAKRNRNISIFIEEDIEVLPHFIWMSIGQIKELMKYPNLVNMDSRTVLSALPYKCDETTSTQLGLSIKECKLEKIKEIDSYFANEKMMSDIHHEFIKLKDLDNWTFSDASISSKKDDPFEVVFYDIEIEGREVRHWKQPLFKAKGEATFGLLARKTSKGYKFLVQAKKEVGCFDTLELGPTIQFEAGCKPSNEIENLFFEELSHKENVLVDTILSEEGGRFYQEANRNIVLISDKDINLPRGYFWVSYGELLHLLERNNMLNIQLRNLMSLLEVDW